MTLLPKSVASEGMRLFPRISLLLIFILFFTLLTFSKKPSEYQKRIKRIKRIDRYRLKATLRNHQQAAVKPSVLGRSHG
jgi:hypothetical protein